MSKVHTWSDRQARTEFVLSFVLAAIKYCDALARSLGDLEGMEEETARIKTESSIYRREPRPSISCVASSSA